MFSFSQSVWQLRRAAWLQSVMSAGIELSAQAQECSVSSYGKQRKQEVNTRLRRPVMTACE
jgi:hypothetical protein